MIHQSSKQAVNNNNNYYDYQLWKPILCRAHGQASGPTDGSWIIIYYMSCLYCICLDVFAQYLTLGARGFCDISSLHSHWSWQIHVFIHASRKLLTFLDLSWWIYLQLCSILCLCLITASARVLISVTCHSHITSPSDEKCCKLLTKPPTDWTANGPLYSYICVQLHEFVSEGGFVMSCLGTGDNGLVERHQGSEERNESMCCGHAWEEFTVFASVTITGRVCFDWWTAESD